ncbi:MAG TPA: hypothetical protein VK663_12420 [Burkholderiales bacterium]|nr:hypothetical protein [Burkholderiales bacterium]
MLDEPLFDIPLPAALEVEGLLLVVLSAAPVPAGLDMVPFGLLLGVGAGVLTLGEFWFVPSLPAFCAYANPIPLTTTAVAAVESRNLDTFINVLL